MMFLGYRYKFVNWNKVRLSKEIIMKKIFFIINCFSAGGGAESLLTQIVNHLNPKKYEIGIMEIIHDSIKTEPVNSNIKIYPYYVKADDPVRKSKMYHVYHEWDKVIQEFIPQDYDLYVSFNYLKPTFLLPKGKKCISWIHGDVYNLEQPNLAEEKALQNEAFRKANRIITISDITTQSVLDLFPEHKDKLQMICNGIDTGKVREKAKEHTEVQLQHPALLSVGRLDSNKNPLRMLDVFDKVYRENDKVHLYYLGYGNLEKDVVRVAIERGIDKNVHLLGYHDNPFPIIAQCDVSCMFSLSEGFPMVLLESVALDKPFVSSVIGGSRILANEQRCGKTMETDEEAANAILEFLRTDKEKIAKECRESIKRFELKEYMRQIETLFDEVMGE